MPLQISDKAGAAEDILISVRAPRSEPGRPFHVDLHPLLSFVAERRQIVRLLAEAARFYPFDAVAGAGLPFGAWLAELVGLPFLAVDGPQLRGDAKRGQQVLLVSGGAPDAETLKALAVAGAVCEHAVVVALDDLSAPPPPDERLTLHALTTWRRLLASPDLGALFTPAQMKTLREL